MKCESAVLKRLGPVPFWRGERKCLDALGEMYGRAMERAQERLAAARAERPEQDARVRKGDGK